MLAQSLLPLVVALAAAGGPGPDPNRPVRFVVSAAATTMECIRVEAGSLGYRRVARDGGDAALRLERERGRRGERRSVIWEVEDAGTHLHAQVSGWREDEWLDLPRVLAACAVEGVWRWGGR